jgi:hypothetical protein
MLRPGLYNGACPNENGMTLTYDTWLVTESAQ